MNRIETRLNDEDREAYRLYCNELGDSMAKNLAKYIQGCIAGNVPVQLDKSTGTLPVDSPQTKIIPVQLEESTGTLPVKAKKELILPDGVFFASSLGRSGSKGSSDTGTKGVSKNTGLDQKDNSGWNGEIKRR